MRTAKDLIKQALTDTGILASGENPDASEMNDCFDTLNDLLSERYANSGVYLFSSPNPLDETLPLTAYPGAESIALLTTDLEILFPPLMINSLRWGLGVDICPMFGQAVPMGVAGKASSSKKIVESLVVKSRLEPANTTADMPTSGGVYDFYTA